MYGTIIKQLDKALEAKDEKELRIRIEVLKDFLENSPEPITPSPIAVPTFPTQPLRPLSEPYLETPPGKETFPGKPTPVTSQDKQVRKGGVSRDGVIVGGDEIPYTRPKGT